ncbi:MAG: hypothetical protein ACJAYB_000062 [Psychromonas sp.]|jgi:hypothetical protein
MKVETKKTQVISLPGHDGPLVIKNGEIDLVVKPTCGGFDINFINHDSGDVINWHSARFDSGKLHLNKFATDKDKNGAKVTSEPPDTIFHGGGGGSVGVFCGSGGPSYSFACGGSNIPLSVDEFNSVTEASPETMRALQRHFNTKQGSLRDLAAAGFITTKVIAGAFNYELLNKEKTTEINRAVNHCEGHPLNTTDSPENTGLDVLSRIYIGSGKFKCTMRFNGFVNTFVGTKSQIDLVVQAFDLFTVPGIFLLDAMRSALKLFSADLIDIQCPGCFNFEVRFNFKNFTYRFTGTLVDVVEYVHDLSLSKNVTYGGKIVRAKDAGSIDAADQFYIKFSNEAKEIFNIFRTDYKQLISYIHAITKNPKVWWSEASLSDKGNHLSHALQMEKASMLDDIVKIAGANHNQKGFGKLDWISLFEYIYEKHLIDWCDISAKTKESLALTIIKSKFSN